MCVVVHTYESTSIIDICSSVQPRDQPIDSWCGTIYSMSLLTKPGSTLLVAGVLSVLVSRVIDIIPFFGGTLSFLLLLAGLFGIFGGLWIIVTGRRNANN